PPVVRDNKYTITTRNRGNRNAFPRFLRPRSRLAPLPGVAVAEILAAIGIYGVVGYAVAPRTREIGVRIALGASGADVLWTILGQNAVLTIAGIIAGLLARRR